MQICICNHNENFRKIKIVNERKSLIMESYCFIILKLVFHLNSIGLTRVFKYYLKAFHTQMGNFSLSMSYFNVHA